MRDLLGLAEEEAVAGDLDHRDTELWVKKTGAADDDVLAFGEPEELLRV
jgi:hypothetical protein